MSRRSRPSRHVRGTDRERLLGPVDPPPWRPRLRVLVALGHFRSLAAYFGTSPAIARRLVLGRPVSARAAARVLARI